jgi:hypothetical protein
VGISVARGEYIQFVDQDDELAPEALERMYALAVREGADIVLGKMAGSMARPNRIFRRNISGGLNEVPAISTLTGHKMFSRDFLFRNDIKFPEGYWRSEDLLFVARCYACAPRIAVLADYTCYFWHRRDDNQNNSLVPFELEGHYDRLSVIIGALRDGTEPGALQDKLLRRLYRVETMNRVSEPFILDERRSNRREAFLHSRRVALSCFPPGVRAGMPAIQKLRASLLEGGTFESLQELARRNQSLTPRIERSHMALDRDGVFRAHLRFSLLKSSGEPLSVVQHSEQWVLDPEFVTGIPSIDNFPVDDPLTECGASLQLEDQQRQVWWYPEGDLVFRLEPIAEGRYAVVGEGDLEIRPGEAAGGGPLEPGEYVVWFSGQLLGTGRRRRLVASAALRQQPTRWTAVAGQKTDVRLDWTTEGNKLMLKVRERPPELPLGRPHRSRAYAVVSKNVKRVLGPAGTRRFRAYVESLKR